MSKPSLYPQYRMKVDAVRKVASGHFFEALWW